MHQRTNIDLTPRASLLDKNLIAVPLVVRVKEVTRQQRRRGVLVWGSIVVLLSVGASHVAGQIQPVFPIHHEGPSWSSTGLIAYRDKGIVYVDEGSGFFVTSDSLAGVWILNPETGDKHRILTWGDSPDWSPDGTQLVVSTGQIYTVNVDGTGVRRLTSAGRNFFPAWSPDGAWIAFDSNYMLPLDAIWMMRSDGSERQVIGPTGARMPEWHPVGTLIVHVRDGFHIATMTTLGNDIHLLTSNAEYYHPEYSPDGSRIAYERFGPPFPSPPQLWVMTADGSGQRQLTTRGGGSPSQSPDGRRIVFVRDDSTRDDPELGVLWIIDVETGEETQLTHQWPEQCVTWPDCPPTSSEVKSWSDMKKLLGGSRR